MKFEVVDLIYLKVSPVKGVMMFGKKGKLSTRYVGPYRVSNYIGDIAYYLDLL